MPSVERPAELSVVLPVYNEQENVAPLLTRLEPVLARLGLTCELIFVDDGSRDGTAAAVQALAATRPAVRLVRLSRNFGHQAALLAGLEASRGDAVVMLDADLQHPPELIPELVAAWQRGADIVQAVRRAPADDDPAKRMSSRWFYRLLAALGGIRVTPGAADFRLMSRPAVDALRACRERCRFTRGLVQWIGFEQVEIPYDAAARHAGRSKYSLRAMLRLAGDAIFAFSPAPLRLAGFAGVLVSLAAAGYLAFVLFAYFFTDRAQPGWTSILATLLVLGGGQLIVLWILGEYVGRLYEEVKQRPIYIVRPDARRPAAPPESGAGRSE